MALNTGLAITLGTLLGGGAAALSSTLGKSKPDTSAIDQAKKDAEQKALQDKQAEDKTKKARQTLLDTPTSGFGPNTNLARSFLTSLDDK